MPRSRTQICALIIVTYIILVSSLVTLGIDPEVNCTLTSDGGHANLTCKIPCNMSVEQVTWQKRTGNSSETLIKYSKRFGVNISEHYENLLSVLQTKDPGTSSIALSQVEKEDDACFEVIFNTFPFGSFKGEVCLPKLLGDKEVICKSPADFSVTLDPPQIQTQHHEPTGTNLQKGRWINGTISPVCNFQLWRKPRTNNNIPDPDEIFTLKCTASGAQKATITWDHEGKPISKEEKVNITSDLITVTSTLHLTLSTLPEDKGISCSISYNTDHGFHMVEEEDHRHEKNLEPTPQGTLFLFSLLLAVPISVVFCITWHYFLQTLVRQALFTPKAKTSRCVLPFFTSHTHNFSDMQCDGGVSAGQKQRISLRKAEEGVLTPDHIPNNIRTMGIEIKQRKESAVKKNRENIQLNNLDSSYTLVHSDEANSPNISNIKIRNETPESETKPGNSSSQEKKNKSKRRLVF